ncbi:hypothetical protein ACHAWF_004003 [Thalassiosira exigua]
MSRPQHHDHHPGGGRAAAAADPLLTPIRTLPRELRNLLAGGLAGMIAKSVVAPIDRIKILYQVTSAVFRLRDVPRVARSIVEKEGFAALWRGNAATMIRVFPYAGVQFMVFDHCKGRFLGKRRRETTERGGAEPLRHRGTIARNPSVPVVKDQRREEGLSATESLASGMIAGCLSVLCTYPLDLARAQLAVLRKKKGAPSSEAAGKTRGVGDVLSRGFRTGGVRGLYRGISPTVLGILPYSGVAFTINEQAKRKIKHATGEEPTTAQRLQCGALSGLFAQTLAYPLEVTRRRMQTVGIVPTSGPESGAVNFAGVSTLKPSVDEIATEEPTEARRSAPRGEPERIRGAAETAEGTGRSTSQHCHRHRHPPSMTNIVRHLFEEQGLRGFYKGVSMNWFKGPVAFGISFTAFDTIQGLFETDDEQQRRSRGALIQRRVTSDED